MDKVSAHNVRRGWVWFLAAATDAARAALKLAMKFNARPVAKPRDMGDDKGRYGQLSWPVADAERVITIARARTDVFDVLRNAQNWPRVVKSLRAVEALGDQRWRLRLGDGRSMLDIKITEDRSLGQIAWHSDGHRRIGLKGYIKLCDTRDGQGTELTAALVWRPAGGSIGQGFVSFLSPARADREMQQLKIRLESAEMTPVE